MGRDARARPPRFAFASGQAGPSPLGAGAAAGSTLPLPAPPGDQLRNSLDAVADRDFALDYLYAGAVLFTHLSRIGEELCLWASQEFGFVRLPENAATGSSAMPQKLNPDVAELRAARPVPRSAGSPACSPSSRGCRSRTTATCRRTRPRFAARRDVRLALAALAVLVRGLEFDRDRLAAAAADPALQATDAAEALVAAGMPFRDAHEQVAARCDGHLLGAGAPGRTRPPRAGRGRGRRPRGPGTRLGS